MVAQIENLLRSPISIVPSCWLLARHVRFHMLARNASNIEFDGEAVEEC